MKRIKRHLWLAVMLASTGITVVAQTGFVPVRVGQYAEDLRRTSTRLADQAAQDLLRSSRNSRREIQDAMLAQQLDASAALLVTMTRNRRSGAELNDAVDVLTDLARQASNGSSQSGLWRQAQNTIAGINRELGPSGPPPGPPPPAPRPVIGRVAWRGFVDDRVQLSIRGNAIEVKTVSGSPRGDGTANFTSSLPTTPVEVSVDKVSGGRGNIRVLQQPSRANDFTAVIEIYDSSPGAQEYRLDIYWQAIGRH